MDTSPTIGCWRSAASYKHPPLPKKTDGVESAATDPLSTAARLTGFVGRLRRGHALTSGKKNAEHEEADESAAPKKTEKAAEHPAEAPHAHAPSPA